MRDRVKRALSGVRRRIQLERVMKGVALLLAYSLFASLSSSYLLAIANFSETYLNGIRFLAGIGFLFILVWFILIPVLRPPSRTRIARFLEERYPLLCDRVSTAVELETSTSGASPDVGRLVQEDAIRSLRGIRKPRFFWPTTSGASLTVSVASVLVTAILYFGGPEVYRYSLNRLAGAWADEPGNSLYQVLVMPGDAVVAERADLEVRASLLGFLSEDVRLAVLYQNQPRWETVRMIPSMDSNGFSFLFQDIREDLQYYVEADGIVSKTFSIEVSSLPRVERLQATLDFPGYTGLETRTIEVERSIRALEGTSLRLELETNQAVKRAYLEFEDARQVELALLEGTRLEASFDVRRDESFHVYLTSSEGVLGPGSGEYFVEALEDQPPTVAFTRPGRDRKVTNIEEVYTEIKAEDDYGISRIKLHYSVNGGADQVLNPGFRQGSRALTTSETIFLEELALEPGDFVSYYAEASDAVSVSTSDIYFLEVEPFTKEYSQSQRAPNGGGLQGEMGLARQQKQIVVATFSLVQERSEFTDEERRENSLTLALLQQRLQTQVNTVIERLRRREAAMMDPRLKKMAEYMETASGHMKPAEEFLAAVKPSLALPDEKSALQHLLRSEALFTEVEVAMSNDAGSGGTAEDLADLIDLELDRTKNQYETFQAGQQQKREEALDDALEKLKELAKRQEQQIERRKRDGSLEGESLVEEIEELSRRLARLSRQEREEQLSKLSRELDRAARDLRRSLSSGQGAERSTALAQQAMQRLKTAQDVLRKQRRNQLQERMNELESVARQLVVDQDEVVDEMRSLDRKIQKKEIDQDFLKQHRAMLRKQGDLQVDLQKLEGDLHQLARQMDSREKAAARKLRQVGLKIRDERLPERMEEGFELAARGLMNMAVHREEQIGRELQTLAKSLSEVKRSLGQAQMETPEERRQRALGEVGDLVEKLDSLWDRLEPIQKDSKNLSGGQMSGFTGEPAEQSAGARGFSEGEAEKTLNGIEPSQLKREWERRVQEAAQLRELLRNDRDLGSDVSQILKRMRQVDLERVLADEDEVARLKSRVLDNLLQLELELNQFLRQSDSHYFRPVGGNNVPSEFRESVEEYHRRLSEK